jgi:hypothetical protein
MWLDWDQKVTVIASQPFRVWWTAPGGRTPVLPSYPASPLPPGLRSVSSRKNGPVAHW